jgi:hypothetical protein
MRTISGRIPKIPRETWEVIWVTRIPDKIFGTQKRILELSN